MSCPECGGVLEEGFIYKTSMNVVVEVYCTECDYEGEAILEREEVGK